MTIRYNSWHLDRCKNYLSSYKFVIVESDRTMPGIIKELEEIEKLKVEIKNRSMVYQAESKEKVAKFYNLSYDYFYYTPYEKWLEIWKQYDKEK